MVVVVVVVCGGIRDEESSWPGSATQGQRQSVSNLFIRLIFQIKPESNSISEV